MITSKVLSNGVQIVMEEMPQVQSVAMGVWVRTGAVNETEKYAGISHFVEHMMFKGTENRTARQIAGDIDRIGGQINAFTGKEATCYYVKCTAGNFFRAADVIVDMLENSRFDKIEMDRERFVIYEEIKMTRDQPDDLAHDTLVGKVFRGDTLGHSVIGTPTCLKQVTRNVIRRYVSDQYVRESMVVSIAGRFDPEKVIAYFESAFQSFKQKKPKTRYIEGDGKPACRVLVRDIQQSHLCLGCKSIALNDKRSYAFQILNNILGGSMSSRLFQNVREQKGLAYTVFSSQGSFSKSGIFEIYAGVSHDRVRAAVEAIREELELLRDGTISQDELDSSREQMKSGYVFSQESTSARMIANGKNQLLFGKIFTPEEVMESYDKVSLEDLYDLRTMITDIDRYSAVLVTGKRMDLRGILSR